MLTLCFTDPCLFPIADLTLDLPLFEHRTLRMDAMNIAVATLPAQHAITVTARALYPGESDSANRVRLLKAVQERAVAGQEQACCDSAAALLSTACMRDPVKKVRLQATMLLAKWHAVPLKQRILALHAKVADPHPPVREVATAAVSDFGMLELHTALGGSTARLTSIIVGLIRFAISPTEPASKLQAGTRQKAADAGKWRCRIARPKSCCGALNPSAPPPLRSTRILDLSAAWRRPLSSTSTAGTCEEPAVGLCNARAPGAV